MSISARQCSIYRPSLCVRHYALQTLPYWIISSLGIWYYLYFTGKKIEAQMVICPRTHSLLTAEPAPDLPDSKVRILVLLQTHLPWSARHHLGLPQTNMSPCGDSRILRKPKVTPDRKNKDISYHRKSERLLLSLAFFCLNLNFTLIGGKKANIFYCHLFSSWDFPGRFRMAFWTWIKFFCHPSTTSKCLICTGCPKSSGYNS